MADRIDLQPQQPTPVDEDATATAPELLARAATDYTNGWGQPDVRATSDGTGSAA